VSAHYQRLSVEAEASPSGLLRAWRVPEGEHVVRLTATLSDPAQATVEGPPLRLEVDEGIITRLVPLTAHGVATQVRGPAELRLSADPDVVLRPASGTWTVRADVRPGRLVEEVWTWDTTLLATSYGPGVALPFGAVTAIKHINTGATLQLHWYSPAKASTQTAADIWWHNQNSSIEGYAQPWPVPRGASALNLFNNDAAERPSTVALGMIV